MLQSFKPIVEKDPNINLIRKSSNNTVEEEYEIESSDSESDHEYVTQILSKQTTEKDITVFQATSDLNEPKCLRDRCMFLINNYI